MNPSIIESFKYIIDPYSTYEDCKSTVEIFKFPKEWEGLLHVILILKKESKEINAENILSTGKNIPTTKLFCTLINQMDCNT